MDAEQARLGPGYMPELEYGKEADASIATFVEDLLSTQTAVIRLVSRLSGAELVTDTLDEHGLLAALLREDGNGKETYELYFVNRYLFKKPNMRQPDDSNKFQISLPAFEKLMQRFNVPLAFISALARYYLPQGMGFRALRRATHTSEPQGHDFWCFIPIRVQVGCLDKDHQDLAGAKQSEENNEMDSFNYMRCIHLRDVHIALPSKQQNTIQLVDIRGFQIGVYFRHDTVLKNTVMITFNFMDGRWSKVVEEPKNRIFEALGLGSGTTEDPFFVFLVFLSSAARWWSNSLSSMNDQLIAHEKMLHGEINNNVDDGVSRSYSTMNRESHTVAAHLHRYGSELESIETTIDRLETYHGRHFKLTGMHTPTQLSRVVLGFEQIRSQFKSISIFRNALDNKIQNNLALLYNRIQLANDRMLVDNGKKMHEVLLAAQSEAAASRRVAEGAHELAREMKKDSVSMKTIAVLTMFFLPGTSFAALLSLPFFAENTWFTEMSRVWVWVVLTVPSTMLAFAFYTYWKKRDLQGVFLAKDSAVGAATQSNDLEMQYCTEQAGRSGL